MLPLERKNLSLHPLHCPISTFTPHFMLTASRPALPCSASQPPFQPQCRAGQSQGQGQGGTSTWGGKPRPCWATQAPGLFLTDAWPGRGHHQDPPLPSPRKTQRPRECYCVSIWLPQLVCPRVRLQPQCVPSRHHRETLLPTAWPPFQPSPDHGNSLSKGRSAAGNAGRG